MPTKATTTKTVVAEWQTIAVDEKVATVRLVGGTLLPRLQRLLVTKQSLDKTEKMIGEEKEVIKKEMLAVWAEIEALGVKEAFAAPEVKVEVEITAGSGDKATTSMKRLAKVEGMNADKLDRMQLIEAGVSLDVIRQCTIPGTAKAAYIGVSEVKGKAKTTAEEIVE